MPLTVRFLGTGDPFATGGRLQSCIVLEGDGARWLLDCGATTLVALQRFGIAPASIDGVLISHLHGDHAGGLPALLLEAALHALPGPRRTTPVTIAGPPELLDDLPAMLRLARWEGAVSPLLQGGLVRLTPLRANEPYTVGPLGVEPYAAVHTPEALSYRLTLGGHVLGYTGDTAWNDALPLIARDADLFICQVYSFARPVEGMIAYQTLVARRGELGCKRLILTHVGPDLDRHLAEVADEVATDGLTVVL